MNYLYFNLNNIMYIYMDTKYKYLKYKKKYMLLKGGIGLLRIMNVQL
jgi:hypothetical protein